MSDRTKPYQSRSVSAIVSCVVWWLVTLSPCHLVTLSPCHSKEPWTTYRNDPQRTGNADGKPGPSAPRVLWAMKSKDHFIASPVAYRDRLFVSGLGFINTSNFYSLDIAIKPAERIVWRKGSPFLELPTVSSPAILDGKVIFGDGMHQTNGAYLYCLTLDKGTPLWQLKVEGTLVHLEGSPTLADGKVYLGGGAAGVLCVDPTRVSLDGKEMTLPATAKLIEAKRGELQKKYEEAKKKKDPFAVPPTDKDLPRPAPMLLWQAGKEKWHVDAPVAVIDGKVLATSAYLDKEKVGERALFCLDAKTGNELWKVPLSINPWGGPSVQNGAIVVSGSSIGYDPGALVGAKGVVAAFDLVTGKPRWRKELPGGVVACVALTKDLAVVTSTDGKVRAYTLARGALRWTYAAGAAFFAPVALGPDTAYAADLKGVVHAVNLKTGGGSWKLDLASEAETAAPGMVYAGPLLSAGRLYVATCNVAGEHANKTTVVACIGDK
jgi:outer membrane protein assembly factor BamB